MNITNTIKVAWKAILTNKSRALLTMLGIIIGVGSVILLTSIGTGLQKYIAKQFEDLGSNVIIITPLQVFSANGGFNNDSAESSRMTPFDERAVGDLRRMREYFSEILPTSNKADKVVYRGTTKNTTILGTTTDYQSVRNTQTSSGRWFSDAEARAGERVALLGPKIAKEIFGKVDPIGKTVRLGDVTYQVVGITEEKGGGFGGPSFDNYVYIPLQSFFRLYNSRDIDSISAQVIDKNQMNPAIAAVKQYFTDERRRKTDEFDVFDQRQILKTVNQILGILTVGLGGIAAISLVVGGIGIMNIMLVSVTERTREIGLRKALGATPNQIMLQFLIESSLLSVLGGAIGVALAALLSFFMVAVVKFPSAITPDAILLAFGVSMAVGVVFGVAPARKASHLSPIEALRSE